MSENCERERERERERVREAETETETGRREIERSEGLERLRNGGGLRKT